MKKNVSPMILCMLFVLIMGMATKAETVSAADKIVVDESSIDKGDMDGNGIIELEDANRMLRGVLKIDPFTEQERYIADLYNDNHITMTHVQTVLKIALKIIDIETVFPTVLPSVQPSEMPVDSATPVVSTKPQESQHPSGNPVTQTPSLELPASQPPANPMTELPSLIPASASPNVSEKPVTPPALDADYADIYIQVIESYGYNKDHYDGTYFMAIDINTLDYVEESDIDRVVACFEEKGLNVKKADLDELRRQGCIEDYEGGNYRIIDGVIISFAGIKLIDDKLAVTGFETWGGLSGVGYESVFEKRENGWILIKTEEVMYS